MRHQEIICTFSTFPHGKAAQPGKRARWKRAAPGTWSHLLTFPGFSESADPSGGRKLTVCATLRTAGGRAGRKSTLEACAPRNVVAPSDLSTPQPAQPRRTPWVFRVGSSTRRTQTNSLRHLAKLTGEDQPGVATP
ncbi:MAG: hypothetical protein ACREDR_35230, partial [Blastocatellia bacterium]